MDAQYPFQHNNLLTGLSTRDSPPFWAFDMTIRLRLTLWYTALLGATLILFSVLVYAALATNLRAQTTLDAQNQAIEVANAIVRVYKGDLVIARRLSPFLSFATLDIDLFASSSGVQFIGIDGNIIKRSENLGNLDVPNYSDALANIQNKLPHLYKITLQKRPFLVYSYPVIVNQQIIGAVQIVQRIGPLENTLNEVSRYLTLGTALSLVLAAIIGALLARRALTPIDTITRTAGSITRTKDLAQRLNIPNDASEVGQLASTFNEMLDRIQQLFKTQERLVADVSHELRTPLTSVQGNVELLQRMFLPKTANLPAQITSEAAEALQETLTEIESETGRMSNMLSDLLLLAQADSGVLQLQMAPVEVDTLLLEVYRQTKKLSGLRKGANAQEVRLGSEDQAIVYGDRERLRQLLLNLAENAIKYTPVAGVITLSLEKTEQWVKVSIHDTGIGIPPEQQEHIFERFYRTDKARNREQGGSGLGLSIVQWIAQAHQGHVTVQSVARQGSTFTLWLPILLSETKLTIDN